MLSSSDAGRRSGREQTVGEISGPAVPVLLDESRHAALLVLGDRGLGGLTELIIGSVDRQDHEPAQT